MNPELGRTGPTGLCGDAPYLTGNIKIYKLFHVNLEPKCWGGGQQPIFSLLKALEASALSKELILFLLTGTGRRNGGFLS